MRPLLRQFRKGGAAWSLSLGVALFASTSRAETEPAPPPADKPADPPPETKPAAPPAAPPAIETRPAMTVGPAASPTPTDTGRFQFGSYGRVMMASDGRGRPGRDADIVAHGTRLDEDTYAELELRREDDWTLPGETSAVTTRMVATMAIGEPLFHQSGKFDAKLAVRNLYLEERGILHPGLAVWVGSRMYRGDDAYLLNWWPLDNLNTVGGGARLELPSKTQIAVHVGMNRLDDPFQYQTSPRPLPANQLGTTDTAILDRARVIESLRAEQLFMLDGKAGLKAVLYGELHQLPSGQREVTPGRYEDLPADNGYVAGLQLGAFTGERDGHVNLFLRYSRGIAAYGGDFSKPYAVALNHTSKTAHEGSVALSGNWETGPFALMVAGYFRTFRAATKETLSYANLDEGAFIVRPHFYFTERAGIFVEGSYQAQQRGVLGADGTTPLSGKLWRAGVVPFLSPAGRGSFKRPHLRAIFLLTSRDAGARAMYAQDDVFARRSTEQFIGLEAEWWFNSSYR